MSLKQNDAYYETMQESLDDTLADYILHKQKANAFFRLYKAEQGEVEALELKLRGMVDRVPLTELNREHLLKLLEAK